MKLSVWSMVSGNSFMEVSVLMSGEQSGARGKAGQGSGEEHWKGGTGGMRHGGTATPGHAIAASFRQEASLCGGLSLGLLQIKRYKSSNCTYPSQSSAIKFSINASNLLLS